MEQPLACDSAIAAAEQALRTHSAAAITPALLAHLSTCPRCRAGLLLTLRALTDSAGPSAASASCATCLAELPAFVDLERSSPARATEQHPGVWAHVWTCRDCASEYLTVHTLLDAERDGDLPSLAAFEAPHPQAPARRRILLTRPMLAAAIPNRSAAWAAYRGSQQHSFVIFDASDGDPPRQVTIIVREEDDERWSLELTTTPPLRGMLLLTAGIKSFTSAFTPVGVATITNIPADLVARPDSPDLELALLPLREAVEPG